MDDLADLAASVAETVAEQGGELMETVFSAGAEVAGAALEVAAHALTPIPPVSTMATPELPKLEGPPIGRRRDEEKRF